MNKFSLWFKIGFYIVVCIILLILMLQNSQIVDFKFLGFTMGIPLVLLLVVTIIIGYILGLLSIFSFSKRLDKEKQEKRANG